MPDVLMPRLSDTMTEGVLSHWLKKEGDEVSRGDILAEIETDKSTMDLEAYDDGILTKILVAEGTTVSIGEPVAVIGEPGDSGGAAAAPTEESVAAASDSPPKSPHPDARVRATPLVRSLARERGIDLTTVHGTGPSGRIIRADLEDLERTNAPAQPESPAPPSQQAEPTQAPQGAPSAQTAPTVSFVPASEDDEKLPLTSIRRITAARLTESAAAPHFYLTVVVDVEPLMRFRAEVNEQLAGDGVKVTVTDLLVRACAVVLRAHPEINASWGGDHIVRRGHVNIGIAVAIDDGLMVPVIRDADRKTAREIGAEARELGDRARAGRLTPDEFSGGTFTISNLGMFGISEFTAVINPPEAAILAVGASVETPVVKDGEVTVTTTMRLTLTVDHRVIDGATGANFLRDVVRVLEEPLRIVV
ncbi:MAG: dihydrolipoamide acetyltransferase family protein [Ornithinimicrobium sp.]|uniref:dihydrolipoamide acetyltransferase family protein n=1 Tax=Ornithinimicrobium sp. TaxID=1977084 RepID=UPI0026DEB268|nr:dihydrolipoamide acetyltransferase family protein [Ornithinimicrobium sp.]MDO5740811.1 dihydrolipoamide acetyltransferase family protein [Ornithinimicrobium sp.]